MLYIRYEIDEIDIKDIATFVMVDNWYPEGHELIDAINDYTWRINFEQIIRENISVKFLIVFNTRATSAFRYTFKCKKIFKIGNFKLI